MLARSAARPARRALASSANLNVTMDGPNAVLGMRRAPANLLSRAAMIELRDTLRDLEAQRDVRGIVIRSELPRIFSGGLDIEALAGPAPDELALFWTALQDLWITLYGLRTPTYAAINGASPAGGCLLAISCDERGILSNAGGIGLNETKLGIVAPDIMFAQPFTRLVGPRNAERFLQLGSLLSPAQAFDAGLVDAVLDDEKALMTHAFTTLERYQQIPSDARARTKLLLRGALLERMERERADEIRMVCDLLLSEPVQRNIAGYLAALKSKSAKKAKE